MKKLLTGDERMSELTVKQFLAISLFTARLNFIERDGQMDIYDLKAQFDDCGETAKILINNINKID